MRRVRLGHLDVGPREGRERIDPPDGVHHALRRQSLGQRRDDGGLLCHPPQLALPGDVEQRGADGPAEREPGQRAEHDPAGRVERAERRYRPERLTRPPADEHAGHLTDHPTDRGPDQGDERDVPAEVADELRRSLRAEHRASDQPDQRQGAGHEATADAGDRRERHDPDRDPIRRVHSGSLPTSHLRPPRRRYNPRALGGVVQLVRTPACHAGGRGFESRRSRPYSSRF